MKVLWVMSRLIGPAALIMNSDYNGVSGSWIQTEFEDFSSSKHKMYFLTGIKTKNNAAKMTHKKNDLGEVFCVSLPRITNGLRASRKMIEQVNEILQIIKPDIIQLWGTETRLHDAVIKSSYNIPKVLYIQGLLGVHTRYIGGYMKNFGVNFRNFLTPFKIAKQYLRNKAFRKQALIEKEIIIECKNLIVDNDFSRAYCGTISEKLTFFDKKLIANSVFRESRWNFNLCIPFTIFTIYSGSPDKGLHQLLKATTIVKKLFPEVRVIVPGPYKIDSEGKLFINRSSSSYEHWLYYFINKNDLNNNVIFIGSKSQKEMAINISKSHIFVNPSIMEVHALSLREAMTVGVPCISTLCGSVNEFIKNGENGYIYRYEEYEMLAYLIAKIFNSKDLALKIGEEAHKSMFEMRKNSHIQSLDNIYKSILMETHYNEI